MLSSRDTLFVWSKADRAPERSFFRAVALRWQPVIRPREVGVAIVSHKRAGTLPKCIRARSAWTPWLLVQK